MAATLPKFVRKCKNKPSVFLKACRYRNFSDFGFLPRWIVGTDGSLHVRCHTCRRWERDWRTVKPKTRSKADSDSLCLEVRLQRPDGSIFNTSIPRMVLTAFLGPCPDGMEACHYPDQHRFNNAIDNLMWGTRKTNQNHRRENGTAHMRGRHFRPVRSRITGEQVDEIRKLWDTGRYTQQDLADMYAGRIGRVGLHAIVHRKTWKDR